jgi:hypothetical protein
MNASSDGPSISGWRITGLRLFALLLLITAASLAIHGYHYGIEDEAIYLPAIKAHLNPALYPHDAAFFQPQTLPTLFDDLVAVTARALHAPVDWTVFGYYLGTLLAFYAGLWALAAKLFPELKARLGGVLLIGTLLTLPVAGTCIFIVDQHLHPRTLATALILLAVAQLAPRAAGEALEARAYAMALLLMVGAALVHIQMAFYGALFLGLLLLPLRALGDKAVRLAGFTPMLLVTLMEKGGPEWQEASRTRTQHYLMRWEWYEWLGAIAPIFLLWGMARLARRRGLPVAAAVALRTSLFAAIGFAAGCVITIPTQLERLTPFQPLRILHLTYIVMILLAGGLLAGIALKGKPWRWALLLLPIAAGMSFAQFDSFPDSHHIEWPGRSTGNDWVEAFNWVKANTPVDAYFVLDPHYMSSEGEDYHGFRGLAERGQMADWDKDPGVALLFPDLAGRWSHEVHALDRWKNFTAEDLHRLHEQFGVGWTVLPYGSPRGLRGEYVTYAEKPPGTIPIPLFNCPYHNRSVVVCKIR